MEGFINFWHPARGYGFIHTEDGRSFFTHITNFNPAPVQLPLKGTLVTFDEGRATKGPVALNVRIRSANQKLEQVTSLAGSEGQGGVS